MSHLPGTNWNHSSWELIWIMSPNLLSHDAKSVIWQCSISSFLIFMTANQLTGSEVFSFLSLLPYSSLMFISANTDNNPTANSCFEFVITTYKWNEEISKSKQQWVHL